MPRHVTPDGVVVDHRGNKIKFTHDAGDHHSMAVLAVASSIAARLEAGGVTFRFDGDPRKGCVIDFLGNEAPPDPRELARALAFLEVQGMLTPIGT